MIEKEVKDKVIDLLTYNDIADKAWYDMCESDLHEWSEQDFKAGFMACFNYFSRYAFVFPEPSMDFGNVDF